MERKPQICSDSGYTGVEVHPKPGMTLVFALSCSLTMAHQPYLPLLGVLH